MSPQEILSFSGVSKVSMQKIYDFCSFVYEQDQDNVSCAEDFKKIFDLSKDAMLTSVTGSTSQEIIDNLNKLGFIFDYKSCMIHFITNPKQIAFLDFFASLLDVAQLEDADIILSTSLLDEVAIDTFKVIFIVSYPDS